MKRLMILATLALVTTFSTVTADENSWMLRFGAVNVSPNDDSGPVTASTNGIAVGDDTQLGFNITYMIDKNWGVEVLGANPFKHSLTGTGTLAGVPLGATRHLPPTISAIYSFDTEGDTKYHVGAGINYTKFFEDYADPNLGATLESVLALSSTPSVDLDLSASTGLSLKAGFDTPIADNWYFSGGIYYIMIDTDADVILNGATAVTVDVDINPWVLMLGFGTTF